MRVIQRKSRISISTKNTYSAMLFILPAFIIISAVCFYPLVNGVLLSFKKYIFGKGTWDWIGLKNFITILSSKSFIDSVGFTLLYCVVSVILMFFIGMALAILVNRKMFGMKLVRSLLIVPWAIPLFVNAFLWTFLFHSQFGVINFILEKLHIIQQNINWIGDYTLAKIAVIIPYVWRCYAFNMIGYLAALQTVDENLYEAAEIDGANEIQKFFSVTVPSIRNVVIIIAILNFIWAFQEFTTTWIITKGGPGTATNLAIIDIYRLAFVSRDFGKAAATGILWLVFLFIFTIVMLKLFLREEKLR